MAQQRRWIFRLSVGTLLLASAWVSAQTNQEINGGIQFNFANPGARSLALGGAFLGLADDATAAVSNPAGVTNLSRPEISAEGRHWNYRTEYLNGGGPRGTAPYAYARSDDSANGLSFASFVFPGKNWAVAAYYHELAHFVTNIPKTQGALLPGGYQANPIVGRADLRITNFGGSLAFRLGDTVSLGAGAAASRYSQKTKDTRYDPNHPTSVISYDEATGEQTKVTFNAGLLWKPSRIVSVGAIYRYGPKFDLSYGVFEPDRTTPFTGTAPCRVSSSTTCAVLRVPNAFGAGVSVHPTDLLTLSVDYDRVQYSQLTDKFTDILLVGTSADLSKYYKAKNADEIHFGIQYTIPIGTGALALRAGLWRDPAHGIQYTGPTNDSDAAVAAYQALEQAAFTGGKSEMHYSGGLGAVFGTHVQIDLGYDSAPSIRTASASFVLRF